ncbi:MAG: hypothetical protein AAF716_03880 [Cyanobacteria bacterium P01_D01_bin.1]
MKRFTLSTFSVSAFSALLVAGAIAPAAQALPEVSANFKIQTLRLSELDTRNKAEERQTPYYPQTPAQVSPREVTAEQDSLQIAEPTTWEVPQNQEEADSPDLSLTERRHLSLDRS